MERTFQGDDELPSLPVPDLGESCRKYLKSGKQHVQALVNMSVLEEEMR